VNDTQTPPPTPADIPPRQPSPEAVQRQTIRDLVTGTALKLNASADIDLDGLEVLAQLLDAQTRAQDVELRRNQFFATKRGQ
jgi:hypothetical protein